MLNECNTSKASSCFMMSLNEIHLKIRVLLTRQSHNQCFISGEEGEWQGCGQGKESIYNIYPSPGLMIT